MPAPEKSKSIESWIWDAACSIRGAKDAPKYKDYILPLIFAKRLCDVFDDELNRIAREVGSRKKAFQLPKADPKLVRFYLPLVPNDPEQPVWSVIRNLSDKITEQKKIAQILSTVQRAIKAQERIIQTTTEMKKALMHKLFTKGLRHEPQKQTEIGLIPDSWELMRIKAAGTVVTGSTPSTKNPEFYGDGYNLISPADLDNGKYVGSAHKTLTEAGFEKCRAIPRDSVLVGCIGNVDELGMVGDDCSATNQQINAVITNSQFNPHFVYYALQFCRVRLEQAAAKVTVPILNKSNSETFQIPTPFRAVQDEIAGCLGVLDQKLKNADQKKAQLHDLFRTFLHELMTAKSRVVQIAIQQS